MLEIHPSSRFVRSYKKLPATIKHDFIERIALFQIEPFHPSLRTHKLHGNLRDCYAFCLRDGYRVLFDFAREGAVVLVNVGSHDEYVKWERG